MRGEGESQKKNETGECVQTKQWYNSQNCSVPIFSLSQFSFLGISWGSANILDSNKKTSERLCQTLK